MKLQFSFEDSAVRASLPPWLDWQVEQLDWVLPGGSDSARMHAWVKNPDLIQPNLFRNWLGKALSIYHPQGELWWNGWLYQIDLQLGHVNYRWSMDQVFSRVMARYPRVSAALDPYNVWAYGDWAEDVVLVDKLGAKEQLISLSFGDAGSAGQAAAQHLHRHNQIAEHTQLLPQAAEEMRIVLQARGWWQRLDWRLDESEEGIISHLPGGKSHQLFGLSGNEKLAQSFECTQADFNLGQICLRMAIVGDPQDEVLVGLHSDTAGQPGGLLASSSLPAYRLQGGWQWLTWEMHPPVTLSQGQRYWLVIERSAALYASNHYSLETDDGRGYAQGECMRWDSSGWVNLQEDVRFALLAVSETSELIEEVAHSSVVDGVLRGVQIWKQSDIYLPRWRTPEKSRQKRIEEWLQLGCSDGTPLSALVNAARTLEIFPVPREEGIPFHLDHQGRLNAVAGTRLPTPLDMLGRPFTLPLEINSQSQVLNRLRWTAEGGLFPLIEP